ncbi:MAG: four helix bundle protein [Candidatus Brocadiia bacterium]
MNQNINHKPGAYDLEERTYKFTDDVIEYVHHIPQTVSNIEIIKQLVRSSGSVGANYIEANESLSKKDFIMRVKISKKEAKESRYWLRLSRVAVGDKICETKERLINESIELMKIFGAIIEKSQ